MYQTQKTLDQEEAFRFVQRNAAWLYEHDKKGSVVKKTAFDPHGGLFVKESVRSPLGERFRSLVYEAIEVMGLNQQAAIRFAAPHVVHDVSRTPGLTVEEAASLIYG